MGCGDSKGVVLTQQPNYPQHQQQIHQVQQQQQQLQQQHIQQQQQLQNQPATFVQRLPDAVDHRLVENQEAPQVAALEINKENLMRYLDIDKEIRQFEARNIQKRLDMKTKQLTDVTETTGDLEQHYNLCLQKTAKEKADVDHMQSPSVKNFLKDQTAYDAQLSKEQEEYLAALSEQELAQKQFEGVKLQKDGLTQEVAELTKEVTSLMNLYKQQDDMLCGFFNGKYGSDAENMLEAELDGLQDRKQRVYVARVKWRNSRLLLHHATNQLAFAVRRWQDIPKIHYTNVQMKYYIATETRNHVIAASQNISNAQNYLNNIPFPYCTADEMATLKKACANIYIDMHSQERQQHAMQCYNVTHRRAAALLQWFDSVIDSTIEKDLTNAALAAKLKEKELRNERHRLLEERYLESTGETINLNIHDDEELTTDEEDDTVIATSNPDAASLADDLPKGEEQPETEDVLKSSTDAHRIPSPLPLNELAPPPSEEAIFGNLDELKRRHDNELAEYLKAQELNKARQQQGLEEKLAERRSRRARQQQQQ